MKTERKPLLPILPNQRLAVLVGAVLLFAVVWNYWLPFVQDFWVQITAPGLPPNVDFFAYYTAGQRFVDGTNPYYYGDGQAGNPLISEYIYPPTFLPFFSLLTYLPYVTARLVWVGLYFSVYLLAFIALLTVLAPRLRLTFASLGAALTVISFPLLFHIRNGQADMLVIGLVLLSFSAYARGWRLVSAFVLSLAALFKVSPAFLLIFFVLYQRDWRYLRYFAISSLVVMLLSLLVVPFHYYPEYVIYILPVISSGLTDYLNQSILRYLARIPVLPQIVAATGLALVAGYAAWAGWRTPAPSRKLRAPLGDFDIRPLAVFFLNLLVILIFQGKAWSMAYVWTILPAALVLAHLLHNPARTWQVAVVAFASFLLVSKIYGYPPLDALNLFGGVLMGSLMVVFSWPKKSNPV